MIVASEYSRTANGPEVTSCVYIFICSRILTLYLAVTCHLLNYIFTGLYFLLWIRYSKVFWVVGRMITVVRNALLQTHLNLYESGPRRSIANHCNLRQSDKTREETFLVKVNEPAKFCEQSTFMSLA